MGYSVLYDYFKSVPILFGLTDIELEKFRRSSQLVQYKKNNILFLQGEEPKKFYIIGAGWIKLYRTMPEGEQVIVDMLTKGHSFGESAIFENGSHMCTAQVIEDAQLLSIPSRILKEQIEENPKFAMNMLSAMSRHHRHHVNALAFNTMLSAPQRIGCFLLKLCPPLEKNNVIFYLPYDKALIAETLGMNGATFSRALNILREKTKTLVDGNVVTVISIEQLTGFVFGPLNGKYLSQEM